MRRTPMPTLGLIATQLKSFAFHDYSVPLTHVHEPGSLDPADEDEDGEEGEEEEKSGPTNLKLPEVYPTKLSSPKLTVRSRPGSTRSARAHDDLLTAVCLTKGSGEDENFHPWNVLTATALDRWGVQQGELIRS